MLCFKQTVTYVWFWNYTYVRTTTSTTRWILDHTRMTSKRQNHNWPRADRPFGNTNGEQSRGTCYPDALWRRPYLHPSLHGQRRISFYVFFAFDMPEETNTTPAPTRMCGRGLGNTRDMRLICGEHEVLILVLMRQTQVTASRQLQILIQSQIDILRWTFNIPQSELHTTASTCQCGASDQESGARFSFPKPKKGSLRLWHYSNEGFRNQQILYDRQLDQRVTKTAFLAAEDFGYCEKWPHESNV